MDLPLRPRAALARHGQGQGHGRRLARGRQHLGPDAILLDLQMPGGSGMEVLRSLSRDGKRPKIILLTAGIDDSSLLEAKALKVDGIVLKNSDPAYLLECLESVERGGSWIDPEIGERIADLANRFDSRRPPLAPREREHAVVNLLRFHDPPAAIVFCATRDGVTHLTQNLLERGFAAVPLSGELSQAERTRALHALHSPYSSSLWCVTVKSCSLATRSCSS